MLRNGDSALTKARGVFSAFTLLPGALSLAARAGLLADGVVIFSFRTTSLHGTRGIFFACRAFGGDAASSGMGRRFGGRRRFPAHVAVDDEKPRSPRIACPSRPSPDCRSVFPALMSAVLPSDEGVFGHEALPRLRALFLTGDVLPKACRPSCCRRAPFQRGFPVCLRLRRQARRLCAAAHPSFFPLLETPPCCALPGAALLPSSQARRACFCLPPKRPFRMRLVPFAGAPQGRRGARGGVRRSGR